MVKTFKKIAALALALALVVCFAVSASAVTVTTTTQYVSTSETSNVKVNVTVSGDEITNGTEVTYYAFDDGNEPVYIDQTTAGATAATFSFQTTADKLKSEVKVGYTGGNAAKSAEIDGYTVTSNKGKVTPDIIPDSSDATVTISNYTPETGFKDVNVDGATLVGEADYNETAGTITVALSGASKDVTITVNETGESSSTEATATALAAGYKYDETENTRMVTVLGVAKNAEKFGVIITKEAIKVNYSEEDFALTDGIFEAKTEPTATGLFAVQVIDVCEEGNEFFEEGAQYNTAVYVQNSDGSYTTYATESVTIE